MRHAHIYNAPPARCVPVRLENSSSSITPSWYVTCPNVEIISRTALSSSNEYALYTVYHFLFCYGSTFLLDARILIEYLKKELGITTWVSEIYHFWKSLPAVRKILGGDFFYKFEFNEFFFPASNFFMKK